MKGKLKANSIAKDRNKGAKSAKAGMPSLSEGKREGSFCKKVKPSKAATKGKVIGI